MKKGKLLIISGFSGVGKGTVVNYIKDNYSDYVVSVSATTRDPRDNEIPGIHYHYISEKEFLGMIETNDLLEHASYVGNYYGTPKKFVVDNLAKGVNVILEIETVGAIKVKEKMPEAKMIFVLPPSADILKDRLVGRHTETEDVINERLKKAAEETQSLKYYEYFVVNDEIDKCANNINNIANDLPAQLLNEAQVETIKNDILKFSKGE